MQRVLLVCLFVFLLPLAACTRVAPPATAQAATPVSAEQSAPVLDFSCQSDSQCVVKNVGNCCGYYPACVNQLSPTDPAGVQAQCAASETMGICGFPQISACACVNQRCEAVTDGAQAR